MQQFYQVLVCFFIVSISLSAQNHATQTVVLDEVQATSEPDSIAKPEIKTILLKNEALASYYHDMFNGRKTASGARFDNNAYTAASRKLPFGTKLRVTNVKNGKSIIVTVNDRGPFVKGRELDLTRRAFFDIASHKGQGVLTVKIEQIIK